MDWFSFLRNTWWGILSTWIETINSFTGLTNKSGPGGGLGLETESGLIIAALNEEIGVFKYEDMPNQKVNGNTNTVYINPLNSLRFVLNKVKKDKINLNKDFWVFTGSSVGVVPINGKGLYIGKIDKIGSVKAMIR